MLMVIMSIKANMYVVKRDIRSIDLMKEYIIIMAENS